jgi:hypothetical protein
MNEPSREAVRVTDHALVRYLERAMDLNLELVREHILTICGNAAAFGATCVRTEGLRFEIVNGVIVTVAPDHGPAPSLISQARSAQRMRA